MAESNAIKLVYGVSFVLHVVGAVALNSIEPEKPKELVTVDITTVVKAKPKPKEPEPEPVPVAAPKPAARPVAQAAPVEEAAPEPAPDFGFAMGSSDGPGGIAVGPKTPTAAPVVKQAAKKLSAVAPPPEAGCSAAPEDADTKAKAISMPHPTYTDDARAAGIEGKVRVSLTLDASGAVTAASVVEGLGHGLDEAAVSTLRQATFTPATHCGKPVASTFTVAVRFAL